MMEIKNNVVDLSQDSHMRTNDGNNRGKKIWSLVTNVCRSMIPWKPTPPDEDLYGIQDTEKLELFKRCITAAKHGDAEAQDFLGYIYVRGNFGNKDEKKGFYWHRKAAQNGRKSAQYNLGYCYEHGIGIWRSKPKKAVKWYRRAAEGGESRAQNNLGHCYEKGIGVSQDGKKAFMWYSYSAANGEMRAYYHLGRFYEEGLFDVQLDRKRAVEYYRSASLCGDKDATVAYERTTKAVKRAASRDLSVFRLSMLLPEIMEAAIGKLE
eukprot:CAMPEP_0167755636 /NCGR_PEP_ID=MMETSP0110_2-20121227/8938_1 /TAXON_ID=629695 /ORGANISM="Gymnochlora sp., Strain CCMP2014" /LENGTH=264 /DNA_ID=CAMNT_0007641653 /DNA_START=6 /DNA_END=800 /DNA_ORIENTATION=+